MDPEQHPPDDGDPPVLSCECETTHDRSLLCAGCGVCYFDALNKFNLTAKKSKREDIYEDDTLFTYSFGKVRWFCSDCNSKYLNNAYSCFEHCLGKDSDVKTGNQNERWTNTQRDEMLVKLNTDSDSMKKMLVSVLDLLQKKPSGASIPDFNSPVRKKAMVTFPEDGSSPAIQIFNPVTKKVDSSYSDKVKMNIRKNAADANSNLLKSLHDAKGLVPEFTGRKKIDGSVEVLFKNFEDANKAKAILDDKLKNAVVNCPAPAKQSRFNLVGLPFEMGASEVVDALVDENKHWLDLKKSAENVVSIKSDPYSCIHVHSVSKCKSSDVYKAIVSVSANMLATLGQRKLSVGFVKCKLYSWKSHGRCYRCQEVGHFVASCKGNIACSKCSGDHYLKDCESDRNRCVNCVLHEKEDISHPSYSPDCPFNK